jgi:hypothetical protein
LRVSWKTFIYLEGCHSFIQLVFVPNSLFSLSNNVYYSSHCLFSFIFNIIFIGSSSTPKVDIYNEDAVCM